jgi:hypothetical protein
MRWKGSVPGSSLQIGWVITCPPETTARIHHGLRTPLARNPAFLPLLDGNGQATHAECELAIAMTRYRLDHGRYPERLDALIPAYLHDIPPDPFDGKPLRLAQEGDQWLLYSIGLDCADDGGAPFDNATRKGDIVLTLKMPN